MYTGDYSRINKWDISKKTLLSTWAKGKDRTHHIVISPDDTKLYICQCSEEDIDILDLNGPEMTHILNFTVDYSFFVIEIAPDGRFLAMPDHGGSL